jgi:hypothetical protein
MKRFWFFENLNTLKTNYYPYLWKYLNLEIMVFLMNIQAFMALLLNGGNLWIGVYVDFAYFYLKIELCFLLEFLIYIGQHIDHNKWK